MSTLSDRLRYAVTTICPDIAKSIDPKCTLLSEADLWNEFCACVLSSQVPYELAEIAAKDIADSGILLASGRTCPTVVKAALHQALLQPFMVQGRLRRYRFPVTKADQLSRAWATVHNQFGSLSEAVYNSADSYSTRAALVKALPGLGPKQASMFLRNVRGSYELAILDRHVLKYMSIIKLGQISLESVCTLRKYHVQERVLQAHAAELGCPVGLVDWAIWIVMRVLKQERWVECHT